MGNSIDHEAKQKSLSLSNGETDVLLAAVLLAGSSLAQTKWEITLMQWLAEHDQSRVGLGIVGFDLSEIAWSANEFDRQKQFFLQVLHKARTMKPWENFGFSFFNVVQSLNNLESLVFEFHKHHIQKENSWNWFAQKPKSDLKCRKHRIYLHALHENFENCCFLCNL